MLRRNKGKGKVEDSTKGRGTLIMIIRLLDEKEKKEKKEKPQKGDKLGYCGARNNQKNSKQLTKKMADKKNSTQKLSANAFFLLRVLFAVFFSKNNLLFK